MAYDRIHSRDSGGDFIETLPAFTSTPLDPSRVFARGSVSVCDWLAQPSHMPASGVLTLKDGSTLSADCWTLTKDFRWVYDVSALRDTRHHSGRKFSPMKAKSRMIMEGRCLDIGSNWGSTNYCHWLLDGLGRLATLEGSGYRLEDFDYIRIPTGRKIKQTTAVIEALGLPKEKFITPEGADCRMQFDELVRPQIPGASRVYHESLPKFFQKHIQPNSAGPEKVYLRRTGRRCLTTQPELEQALIARGFTIIDPAKVPFGSWSSARVLVAAHQAGLADLMFCRPGLKMLELISPSWQRPYFHSLALAAGADYWAAIGTNKLGGTEDVEWDFTIPPEQVLDWCDHVGA